MLIFTKHPNFTDSPCYFHPESDR